MATHGFAPRARWWLGAVIASVVAVAAALVVIGGSRPAHADLQNPRQNFLRASTADVFLHWGMLTLPGYVSCRAGDSAITRGGWDFDYWVTEAQELLANYLVLATFHSKLGYSGAWPSGIPGTCSAKRDFLGELITAAHAKKLEVILYVTNDAQWYDAVAVS